MSARRAIGSQAPGLVSAWRWPEPFLISPWILSSIDAPSRATGIVPETLVHPGHPQITGLDHMAIGRHVTIVNHVRLLISGYNRNFHFESSMSRFPSTVASKLWPLLTVHRKLRVHLINQS